MLRAGVVQALVTLVTLQVPLEEIKASLPQRRIALFSLGNLTSYPECCAVLQTLPWLSQLAQLPPEATDDPKVAQYKRRVLKKLAQAQAQGLVQTQAHAATAAATTLSTASASDTGGAGVHGGAGAAASARAGARVHSAVIGADDDEKDHVDLDETPADGIEADDPEEATSV